MEGNVTDHFNWEEFACKDGTPVPSSIQVNVKILAEQLEIIRKKAGSPLIINSGYRTISHNFSVGGKPSSFHLIGKASDLKPTKISTQDLFILIKKLMAGKVIISGGLKNYGTFVHYDIRGKITLF